MPKTYLKGDLSRPTGLYLMLSLPTREDGLPLPYHEKGHAVFFGPLNFVQGWHNQNKLVAYSTELGEDGMPKHEYEYTIEENKLAHEGVFYKDWAVMYITPED